MRNLLVILCLLSGLLLAACDEVPTDTGDQTTDNGQTTENDTGLLVVKNTGPSTPEPPSNITNWSGNDPTPDDKQCRDLIGGQKIYAGKVCIWNDGDTLYVEYNLENNFEMSEANVYAGTEEPDSKGIPGRFPHIEYFDPPVDHHLFEINLDWADKSKIYVATHAATATETLWGGSWSNNDSTYQYQWSQKWGGYFSTCVAPIPPGLEIEPVAFSGLNLGSQSFWDVAFDSGDPAGMPSGKLLNGYWAGWCVDRNHDMYAEQSYMAKLYSTYDPNIPDSGDMPILSNGNWEFVNFMINQRNNPDPGGPFDGVDWTLDSNKQQLQNAIWFFTDGVAPNGGSLGEQFAQYAIDHGDNFIPCEGDYYGMVLYPNINTNDNQVRAQMEIIEVDP